MYGGKVKKMMGGGKAMGTGAMAGGMGKAMASPAMKKRMEMAMMKAGAGGAAGGMKMGGKIKRKKMTDESGQRKVKNMKMGGPTARTKRIMNEKDEIRRVDKEIRKNEGYKDGGKVKAFKPHMMYDKKTGKAVKAPTKAKHLELKKKGYGHTKGKKMMMGGKVKGYKKGGAVSSASKRADGIATKGHTRGRMV